MESIYSNEKYKIYYKAQGYNTSHIEITIAILQPMGPSLSHIIGNQFIYWHVDKQTN